MSVYLGLVALIFTKFASDPVNNLSSSGFVILQHSYILYFSFAGFSFAELLRRL